MIRGIYQRFPFLRFNNSLPWENLNEKTKRKKNQKNS